MSLIDALATPTAEVIVGATDNIETFFLHKHLLCSTSTYFQAALNNGFAETGSQKVFLDDEDPEIFRIYALWLYQSEIDPKTVAMLSLNNMISLYIFADKRGIKHLANDTITMLASFWACDSMDLDSIKGALSRMPRSSKLYDLIIDNVILELRGGDIHPTSFRDPEYPKTFVLDLLEKQYGYDDFTDYKACLSCVCRYHLHDGDSEADKKECIDRIEHGTNILYKPTTESVPKQIKWHWG